MGATRIDAKNIFDRIDACESLLNPNKIDPFLMRMVTGDEKWVTYDNVKRKRSWSKSQESSSVCLVGLTRNHPLWASSLRPNAQFEPVLPTTGPLEGPSLINRGWNVFHQDNARPHTSLVTLQNLRELGWEFFLHPPYSPDHAPSDYHLFLSMTNALGSLKLATREFCESNREASFYEMGIMKLATRWERVIEQNGLNRIIVTYFINN